MEADRRRSRIDTIGVASHSSRGRDRCVGRTGAASQGGLTVARMSVDDMVGRDPRVRLLAKSLGWSMRETVGCLVMDVWPICYDQMTHLISERVIDAAADREGFAALLIEAELAHRDRSGKVYVAGAKKRIEYLAAKHRAGSEGGRKSAERRTKEPKQTSSTRGSTAQAAGNPPVPDNLPSPVLVPVSAPDPVLIPDLPKSPPGAHQSAIAAFDEFYRRANGTKPTWGPKNAQLMARLLKQHGLDEIRKRIAILERSPPKFPPPPWDMGMFSQHFDKLVSQAPQGLDYFVAVGRGDIA